MTKLFKHLKVVFKHKWIVFLRMAECGRPIQGLLHDMSKFSPTELFTSAKYFQGYRSPIEAEKEDKGYSIVWLHHKGRNKHHSQYWCDVSHGEVKSCKIPEKYLIELICDGVAAGMVYSGKNWNCRNPLEFYNKRDHKSFYHPETRAALKGAYTYIANNGWKAFAKLIRGGVSVYSGFVSAVVLDDDEICYSEN